MNKSAKRLSIKAAVLLITLVGTLSMILPSLHIVLSARASSDLTISNGTVSLTIDEVNPITTKEVITSGAPTGVLIEKEDIVGKTVVFTSTYHYINSETRADVTDYAVTIMGTGVHKITDKKSGGDLRIPVPGYVISVPNTVNGYDGIQTGDEITVGGAVGNIKVATETVDNLTKGIRVPINYKNVSVRNKSGIIYYTPDFGPDTKQNQWGTEMSVELNSNYDFVVKEFRGFATGSDTVGIAIPSRGFALSGYVENAGAEDISRASLLKDVCFSVGDIVKLSGLEYVNLESQVETSYDYLDPTDSDNPAGAGFLENRGANQLILYTKSADTGSNKLNTNHYGYEAAVDANGIIIAVAVNVLEIPAGGFVVSGHGTAGDWIRNNMKLGGSVLYDNTQKTLTVVTNVKSFLTTMQGNLARMKTNLNIYKVRLYDLDIPVIEAQVALYEGIVTQATAVEEELKTIEEGSKERFGKLLEFDDLMRAASPILKKVTMLGVESRVVDGRAAWHRPNVLKSEQSLADILVNLNMFKECGINSIFVETLWGGYSSFKSEYVTYHPELAKFTYGEYEDYLTAFVAEAKKLDIEVHAWVENFFVGASDNLTQPFWQQKPDTILGMHPEWAQYTENGLVFQPNERSGAEQFVFVDPANPEVRTFLLDYYEEIYTKLPEIAGLNLDYIRYPTDVGFTTEVIDSGYSRVAITNFLAEYGYSIPVSSDDAEYRATFVNIVKTDKAVKEDWHNYRVNVISSFVKEVRDMTDKVKPEAIISTSTVPEADNAVKVNKQDWVTWVRSGWIDLCTPMSYYMSADTVLSNASQMITIINNISYSYVGLGPYQGFEPMQYITQIEASYKANATGYNLFSTADIIGSADAREALKTTANRKAAIVATSSADDVVKAIFDGIMDKAERLYNLDITKKQALNSRLDTINALDKNSAEQLVILYKEVKSLSDSIAQYASGWAEDRIKEDLALLQTNIDIKISRAFIAEGKWNPQSQAIRPDKQSTTPTNPNTGSFESTNNAITPAKVGGLQGWHIALIIIGSSLVIGGAGIGIMALLKTKAGRR